MKTTTWLIAGNGNNWGKGKTLLGAFANVMHNDSHTYPTTLLHIREVIVDHEAPLFKDVSPEDVFKSVYVDEMGAAYWPAGAEVRKLDVGKSNSGDAGVVLAPEMALVFKAWRAFAEEWTELVCTDAMEAFDGDANEGTQV